VGTTTALPSRAYTLGCLLEEATGVSICRRQGDSRALGGGGALLASQWQL